jgi:3-phenylpropionate/trans-cinnamate dioxygenase ferredoxin subunit
MKIEILDDGPYRLDGVEGIEIIAPGGSLVPVTSDTIFLCRCGGSTNKPFCDGTHSKIGFQGAIAAVESADTAS